MTAKPPAEVSWYKNGQQLQSSEYVHFVALHDIDQISHACTIFTWKGPRDPPTFPYDEALQQSVQSLGLVVSFAEKFCIEKQSIRPNTDLCLALLNK